MEHSYGRSGTRPATSSSSSPEPLDSSSQPTLRLEEPPRKQRRSTQSGSPGGQNISRTSHQPWPSTDARQGGHVVESNVAQGNARVHYGDNYYYRDAHTSATQAEPLDIAKVMESLSFAQMNTRQGNISRTHLDSCEWLFDQAEYLNWRDPELISEHCGLLWIKAKPGSGKSTMMKFLLSSAKKQLPSDTTISFFFHARGDELQKSLEGMYRSLLHQLLTAFPQLLDLHTLRAAQIAPHTWSVDSLRSLFHDAVLGLENSRLTCFIDALDECPEDEIRDLIDALGDLSHSAVNEKVAFHVCFASRHYPYISIERCQHLTLDTQEGHKQDISDYVVNKLAGKGKVMSDIKIEVQARAQGIFLWAVLVVHILNREYDRGSNARQLRGRLGGIPDGLHELFQDIIQRGMQDDGDREHLLHVLQWVLYAQRPLSPEELYFAIYSGSPEPIFLEPWNHEEIDLQSMHLFVLNASKGLTEMVWNETGQGNAVVVQFIHESVRDYLRQTGFGTLSKSLDANPEGLAHNYLYQCCSLLLTSEAPDHLLGSTEAGSKSTRGLRSRVSEIFPFLDYSASSIIYHAEMAQRKGISQSKDLETFPLSRWIRVNGLFASGSRRLVTERDPTKASVFALYGARNLLTLELDQPAVSLSPLEIETALRSAFDGDCPETFAIIMEKMQRTCLSVTNVSEWNDYLGRHFKAVRLWDIDDVAAVRSLFIYFETRHPRQKERWGQHKDWFLAAALNDQVGILCLMLEWSCFVESEGQQASVLNALLSAKWNETESAAHSSTTEFGVMQDLRRTLSRLPLDLTRAFAEACGRGLQETVVMLLHIGADIDAAYHGRTPLIWAIDNTQLAIVRLLLDQGSNVHCGHAQRTPLHVACSSGYDEIVRMLLDNNAHLEARDTLLCTPLHVACINGHESVIRILLEMGSNHDERDIFGHTPLHQACSHGHESIVRILLANGANVNPPGVAGNHDDCTTPLMLACEGDQLTIVQLLLEAGADTSGLGTKASYHTQRIADLLRRSGAMPLDN
jgi:hypothetical protein